MARKRHKADNIEEEMDSFIISDSEHGIRLDVILTQRFQDIQSRTYFHSLFEENRILVNGLPVKKSYKSNVGDEIQIFFLVTSEIGLEPEPIPLNILYEDDHFLVVNKPSGLVVHPAPGNWKGTFVNALLYHCQQLPEDSLRPGIVHRLDKDTSGLLIAAKTSICHLRFVDLFSQRKIYKEYLAVCIGNPGNTTFTSPIGRHPIHRKRMAVVKNGGRDAVTHCKVLKCDGKLSLLSVVLETGRTHQIRVHLQHHGCPILGDALYGNTQLNTKYRVSRQMLHAKTLRFRHPITDEELSFDAPLPDDMNAIVRYFL